MHELQIAYIIKHIERFLTSVGLVIMIGLMTDGLNVFRTAEKFGRKKRIFDLDSQAKQIEATTGMTLLSYHTFLEQHPSSKTNFDSIIGFLKPVLLGTLLGGGAGLAASFIAGAEISVASGLFVLPTLVGATGGLIIATVKNAIDERDTLDEYVAYIDHSRRHDAKSQSPREILAESVSIQTSLPQRLYSTQVVNK